MEAWPRTGEVVEESREPPKPGLAEYRGLRRRATLARASLGLIALASIITLVFEVDRRFLLAGFGSGDPLTFGEAEASDDRLMAVAIAQVTLGILSAIFFIAWLKRAYENLRALGATDLRYGTGWAVGAWFVPFLNLVRPKQIVDDAWRGSNPYMTAGSNWRGKPVPRVLDVWWAFYLLAGFVGAFSAQLEITPGNRDDTDWIMAVFIGVEGLTAIAASLAVIVIDRITARQAARHGLLTREEQPLPAQWLRGRRRAAAAAAFCAAAAGFGVLTVAVQPDGEAVNPADDATTPAQQQPSTSSGYSLRDDFSDPASGWVVEEGDGVAYAYVGDEYRMTVTSSDLIWFSLLGLGATVDPMQVEVDVKVGNPSSSELEVGLGCYVAELYGYFATVTSDDYYTIGMDPVDSEELALLADGEAASAFGGPLDATRLGLLCESGPPARLTLTVNGRTVGEAQHDEGLGAFEVAALVFGATGRASAHFDNFAVSSPTRR